MTAPWVARGRLTAGGKSLEYACHGPAPDQAPTLVLLHEGLGCVDLWRGFPAALADATGFGVFVWSRAGYGQSGPVDLPRPLDYMSREAIEGMPPILDAIGLQRGVLLGHSDGATISVLYAGGVSDMRIRGVVAIAPHFFTEESGLAAIAGARDAYETGDLKSRLAKYHRDPDMAFRGWNDAWLDPGFRDWNVADSIDYLRVPVLAVQGRGDPYGTLAQIEELETRSYAPVDNLILNDCGHAPHLEHPETVISAVAEFCVRLERIEAATPAAS